MWTTAAPNAKGATFAALAACVLCTAVAAAENRDQAAIKESQPALWKQKELNFVYYGFTTKYSCDGLHDKIREVLLDLGARKKDLKVRETGCTALSGRPEPFPGVRVTMSVPVPAGPGDDSENVVPAHWQAVDLKLHDTYSSLSNECELVEQIRQQIVPLFTARNVDLKTDCIPHQASVARPVLKLEVLLPDKKDDKAAAPR